MIPAKKNSAKLKPRNHTYSLELIRYAIDQVVKNDCSLRKTVDTLKMFRAEMKRFPSHTTIHNWIMKLGSGCYLKRPKGKKYQAYIIDATIEFGQEKLLLVIGVPRKVHRAEKWNLTHQDVDVLRMKVVKKLNSAVVLETLRKTAVKYGNPVQIIADHGSDIKKGIEDFCKQNPKVTYTYDITHYNAIILKYALAENDDWERFYAECGRCRRRLINTDFIPYAPPAARDKSRHLNLERYIRWVNNILYVSRHKKNRECPNFQKHFSWVNKFKKTFEIWQKLIDILKKTKSEVARNGLMHKTFDNILTVVKEKLQPETESIINKIADYCHKETQNIPEDQSWLCCSDIIESIFGRFKRYARRAPMREISRMAVTIPIFTSQFSTDKIKNIFEFKTNRNTLKWLKNNMGETMTSKRRKAFRIRRVNKS